MGDERKVLAVGTKKAFPLGDRCCVCGIEMAGTFWSIKFVSRRGELEARKVCNSFCASLLFANEGTDAFDRIERIANYQRVKRGFEQALKENDDERE